MSEMSELMEFSSNDYMNIVGSTDIDESKYPYIVNDIMKYINEVKMEGDDLALIDIIMEYSFKTDINVLAVGDAINSDEYFKSFIEKDCELHRIFRKETQSNW